jgi:hypothetical protein
MPHSAASSGQVGDNAFVRAWQIGIKCSICDYTFEIALADKVEQVLTHALNVIRVQQPFTVRWDQIMQPMLTVS